MDSLDDVWPLRVPTLEEIKNLSLVLSFRESKSREPRIAHKTIDILECAYQLSMSPLHPDPTIKNVALASYRARICR